MPLSLSAKDFLLDTIASIAASKGVSEFIIGLTANPSKRRYSYLSAVKLLYPHFVVLEQNLSYLDALKLEKYIQGRVKQEKALYKKYNSDRRDSPHISSIGGRAPNPKAKCYSIYMTWK